MWLKHLKEKVDGCEFKLYYKKIRLAKNFEKTSIQHRLKLYNSFLTFIPRTIYQTDADYIKLKENLKLDMLSYLNSPVKFDPDVSVQPPFHSVFAIEHLLVGYNKEKIKPGMSAARLQKLYPFETDINYVYLTDKEARLEFGDQQVNRAVRDQDDENSPYAVGIERFGKKIITTTFSSNPFNQTAGQVRNIHLPQGIKENVKKHDNSSYIFR